MIKSLFKCGVYMENTTCCFIGHREINETEELKSGLYKLIERLISENNVDTFLFGSKSRFNSLCYETVTGLKEKYPHIKRIYVRAEYPVIDRDYENYILKKYEGTYFPEKIKKAGKSAYLERNFFMIDNSRYCVFYFDKNLKYQNRNSGTKSAFEYANKKGKEIFLTLIY